jgi:hypothetical protein
MELETLQKEITILKLKIQAPASACIICMDSLPNIVLQPCHHQPYCEHCFAEAVLVLLRMAPLAYFRGRLGTL